MCLPAVSNTKSLSWSHFRETHLAREKSGVTACYGGNISGHHSLSICCLISSSGVFFFCHGDRFSGLINSAQTQNVSSRELREGLRILGGSDTLSEVEHQALFRNISRGQDRIQYKVSGHEIPISLPVIRGRHKEGDTHARTRARTHRERWRGYDERVHLFGVRGIERTVQRACRVAQSNHT